MFSALVQTTRTLRLRRNVVKLSLYRHFTHVLIFAVLSSVVFMLWSIKFHKMEGCLTGNTNFNEPNEMVDLSRIKHPMNSNSVTNNTNLMSSHRQSNLVVVHSNSPTRGVFGSDN